METGINLTEPEKLVDMSDCYSKLNSLIEMSALPKHLQSVDPSYVKPNILNLCNHLHDFQHGIVFLTGMGQGKTTNAAAILLSYMHWKRYSPTVDNIGFYVSALELCRRNDYRFDEQLELLLQKIMNSQCVVIDGVPNYMTLKDEQLIAEIYEKRLYADGITIFTSSMVPDVTLNSSAYVGSVITRISANCKLKEVFT